MAKIFREPCPVCSASQPKDVQHQHLQLAGLGRVDITFGHCGSCGHIYQTRQPSPKVLERHYASFSNYTVFDVEAARNAAPSALTRRLMSLADAHAPNKGFAYEVGCATAPHLAQFKKAGWSVGGCDPSAKACAQAREVHDIEIDCGTEIEAFPKRSNLDLVLFSHVLEHLKDPRSALVRARNALSDNGLLLLEVPCATAPHLVPPGWFSFEHLHYFTEAAMVRLLQDVGFAPLEVRIAYEAYIYPVIAVIARKAEPRPPSVDGVIAAAHARHFLNEVTARDDRIWHASGKRLQHLNGETFVWGAGVHTAQLFDRTPLLRSVGVKAIIDRDSQKWGMRQAGIEIVSPDNFFADKSPTPIVISSFAAEAEIAATLSKAGVPEERIVRLYA